MHVAFWPLINIFCAYLSKKKKSIICKLDSKTMSERMFCFIMPYYFCFRNDLIVLEANEKTQKTKYY